MEASPKHTSPGVGSGAVASRLLMVQPDSVLCKLSARGSDDAFAVLHARYRQQVFAFVFHLLDRPSARDDAEDITQEVFSKAYTAMHSKQPDGSFKHWLFTIARNRTFDAIRAIKPNAIPIDTTEDAVEMPTSGQSASSAVEAKQELAWLVGTVSSLPDRQREALVMRELAGMSHAQIADALETSVPATKQLISRGRESVHEAARENGYRSRKLGRELAMAAPILPFVAFNFGAATSTASAATASAGAATGTSAAVGGTAAATGAGAAGSAATATGIGGLALGTKVAATILTVAAVGGGTVVAERAVTGESPQSTSATTSSSGSGVGAGGTTNNGLTPAEAQQQAAEKKREARAKAKRAKQRANAKRKRAAARAKAKRVKAKKNALRKQNAAANKGGKGTASGGSSSGGSSDRVASNGGGSGGSGNSSKPTEPKTSEPPGGSNGGSGQGNSGQGNSGKGKP